MGQNKTKQKPNTYLWKIQYNSILIQYNIKTSIIKNIKLAKNEKMLENIVGVSLEIEVDAPGARGL